MIHFRVNSDNTKSNEFIISKTELITGIVLVALTVLAIIFILMKRNKNKNDLEKEIKVDDLKNEAENPVDEKEETKFVIPENPLASVHEKLVAQDSAAFITLWILL